jgi:acyl-homoserine-lactone acylase
MADDLIRTWKKPVFLLQWFRYKQLARGAPDMLRKSWKTMLLVALVAVGAFVLWALWPERPDTAAFAGLGAKYNVEIVRDEWGVPHIYGKTDADAAFGLAFAHAEDDFLTIQQTLAASQGMLAASQGVNSAPADYLAALLRVKDVVDSGYATLTPPARAVMEAYADGLNYYAYKHPDQALLPRLFPVTGRAIVASSVYKSPLFFGLDSTIAELYKDTRQREVAVRKGSQVQPTGLESAAQPGIFQPTGLLDWLANPDFTAWNKIGAAAELYGSNTFAVGPSRTRDGSTYLAINSHQPWTGPVAWYEAHVHSTEGWEASGATFPATPAIIHGHNRNLGWAFTVNHPDLTDVYVLEMNPDNPNQYRFDGAWRTLEVRQAPIQVKLFGRFRWTVKQEVLWSVYGPAVRRPHGVYALRYAGYGKVNVFEQLYQMNKAATLEEWQQAMKNGGLPNFNAGYADAKGNTYYLYNAMLPMRSPNYDWSLYLPGNTSETLWNETLPFEQLPQVLNPPSGFVQNANSTPFQTTTGTGNPNPANYAPAFGIETTMTNRALRALELFGSDPSITFDEFRAYKFDRTYSQTSNVAGYTRFIIQAQVPSDSAAQQAREILRTWNLTADVDSIGMTVMEYWLEKLSEATHVDFSELANTPISDEILLRTFVEAADLLQKNFGHVDVAWGEANRLQRGKLDLPRDGGPDLLRASYGDFAKDGRIIGNDGDGYIMLVRWDAQGAVQALSVHQFGSATLDAGSPHYNDQSPLYVRHELKQAWFAEADVRAHASRTYRP